MSQILRPYKGYIGQIDVDIDAGLIHGRVLGLRDVISFDGLTVDEANKAFHKSVDTYLAFCEEIKVQPEKTFSGKIAFRTNPQVHQLIYTAASIEGKSINAWMDEVLAEAAERAIDNVRKETVESRPPKKFTHV